VSVSLRTRLLLASGVLALVVVVAIVAMLRGNAALEDATDRRADARLDLAILAQIEKDLLDLETGMRGFVITGDEQFLQPWDAARRRLPRDLSALRARLSDHGDDQVEVRALAQASMEYLRGYTHSVIAAVRAGRPEAASRATTTAGKRRIDRIRGIAQALTRGETAQAASTSTSANARARDAGRFGIAALAASSALMVLFTVYLLRGIVAPIRRVSSAADDLASGNLAARAPEGGVQEFARLGVSFNKMASTIADSHTSMDARNRELDRAMQDAERANQAKSEFISRMSHELRTPLNAILGFAQLLGLDELDDGQRESVDQIVRAGRHLLQLIDEVLDIARMEAGELRFSPEPVGVSELIGEALALVAPLATQRSIRLMTASGDRAEAHVMADRQRLKQILLNLLSNAIKYNREGGDVRVSVDFDDSQRIAIAIADTGAGILPEELSKLFAPFERLGAEFGSVDGTGLGLALSRRLAEAMGGTLEVESVPREGSTFSIQLQRVAAPEFAEEIAEPLPVSFLGDRTILYIEDNLSNLRLVERLLARYSKVTLLPAMQGSIGLELAREHHPDMVLLDLHLPDLGGDEVLLRLRAEPATRDTPVVVLSADASPGQVRRLREAGATAYLTKPIDLHELLEIVERCLGESPASAT
jgi:signal transduction histidine kinase/ActR/RegA family two-component response regulator